MSAAYLSLGSNAGNRVLNLNRAIDALRAVPEILSVESAFLYTTTPWGKLDQPIFLNSAARITTSLGPNQLLQSLKTIEAHLGRNLAAERWSQRLIDIDIILFDDLVLESPGLTIPHAHCHLREFVIKPLIDAWPAIVHPKLNCPFTSLYTQLDAFDPNLHRVLATPSGSLLGFNTPYRPEIQAAAANLPSQTPATSLVAILNLSPDSFSGDAQCSSLSEESVLQAALALINHDAVSILDIGIQSTKPNAVYYPFAPQSLSSEESARLRLLTAVIARIRMLGITIPISIDTINSHVAETALKAGASIINDVSGGRHDPHMLPLAAKYACPIILCDSQLSTSRPPTAIICHAPPKSTPRHHHPSSNHSAEFHPFVEAAYNNLASLVSDALSHGIHKYNIILDIGIGFSKTPAENLILTKNINAVLSDSLYGFPSLIGPSRKRHLELFADLPALMHTHNVSPLYKTHYLDYLTSSYLSEAVHNHITFFRTHNVHELSSVLNLSRAFACAP